jgi:hypothetical protein
MGIKRDPVLPDCSSSLREEVCVHAEESREARTAYSFAQIFAEELKLIYASRQQRAEDAATNRPWSDGMIQLASTILDRAKRRSSEKNLRAK